MGYYPTIRLRFLTILEIGDIVGFLCRVSIPYRANSLLITHIFLHFTEVLLRGVKIGVRYNRKRIHQHFMHKLIVLSYRALAFPGLYLSNK